MIKKKVKRYIHIAEGDNVYVREVMATQMLIPEFEEEFNKRREESIKKQKKEKGK